MSSQAVAWAIVMKAGGPSAKAVLMAVANYANEYGECWASQDTLAEGAELKTRQLRTILADLIDRGLIERERRGGEGRGRQTDMLRLRMRELPAILTAKRRPETAPESNRQSLPEAGNRQSLPVAIEGGATGNLRGGNRQMVAGTIEPKKPRTQPPYPEGFEAVWAMWPKHVRASSKAVSAQRLAKLGASAAEISAAVTAYLRSHDAVRENRRFVPAFEAWLNTKAEFWLEQTKPDPAELERRRKLFEFNGTWNDAEWGPRPTKGATA